MEEGRTVCCRRSEEGSGKSDEGSLRHFLQNSLKIILAGCHHRKFLPGDDNCYVLATLPYAYFYNRSLKYSRFG